MRLQPEVILTVCRAIVYPAWRDRVLTPVTTMRLFRLQMLHGNTACSHLPQLSGLPCTAAASCQARARLPIRLVALLVERFSSAAQRSTLDEGRWHGHRPFLVEGSGGSLPDTPDLQDAFGPSTERRYGRSGPWPGTAGLRG
jgi:hypothetical protein